MAKWTFEVDPTTGSFIVEDGDFRRCKPGIMAAMNAVLTERGSVPGMSDFGSTFESVTHLTESTVRDMERAADQALRPLRGIDFDDYEREASWDAVGNPTLLVRTFSANVEETRTVPLE